jgi:carbamoyl-phosphate synthase large subunit
LVAHSKRVSKRVDPRWKGFKAYVQPKDLDRALSKPTDMRLFAIAHAMYNKNYSFDQLHDLTRIDKVRSSFTTECQCIHIRP